jgi:DNA-binding HxlR family transcriptional regulator
LRACGNFATVQRVEFPSHSPPHTLMLRPTASSVAPPDDDCPLGLCVAYISGVWTPHILWYLRAGPRRFGDLRRDLEVVSAKVLTEHLRALEERLMVERKVGETSPRTIQYSLTPFGQRFNPILDAIIEVGREIKSAKRSHELHEGAGLAASIR